MTDLNGASGLGTPGGLFQLLRDGRPRTRAELAESTGVARSTIASRVDALLASGLVAPVGEAPSTGGRPSSQFAVRTDSRVIAAADLGASHASIALTHLDGQPMKLTRAPLRIAEGPEKVLGWVIDTVRAMLLEIGRPDSDLTAIGIGVPGPVEHVSGRPINPPIMPGWDRFDIPGWIREQVDVPVLVDNDVNIMALGERAVSWPHADHLVFVKVATGIGAGIISGGGLQRGAQGIAGDIGHVQIPRGADVPCHCGGRGCLEALAAGPAIARALRSSGVDAENTDAVIDLVRLGDLEAIQAVRQAGRDIGEVLAALVSITNPSVIVIGGSMAQVGEHLIAGLREIVYTRSMPLATEHLQIVQSAAGRDAGVFGAAMLALEFVLSATSVDAIVKAV